MKTHVTANFRIFRYSITPITPQNSPNSKQFLYAVASGMELVDDMATLIANRKKDHFMKGDRVIVMNGDLNNLKGHVVKVEQYTVHITPNHKHLPQTLAFSDKELCKYFDLGNHVKVVSGSSKGATGMVVSVQGHVVNLISDTTKELLRVFADNVVESSEVTSGLTRIGEYELHDLVILYNKSFGVIIRVDSEAFQVLKGVPDTPEVALVRLSEIKAKVEKKGNAQDRFKNHLMVKDVVKVLEGPYKGKKGPIEHIFKGVVFIYDRHHLEHAGFVCAKTQSCALVGGSRVNGDRNGNPLPSRFAHNRAPPRALQSPMRSSMSYGGRRRGRREHNALVGADVKIRLGPFRGCKGRVVDMKGTSVRVELEAKMKFVRVDRNHIEQIRLLDSHPNLGRGFLFDVFVYPTFDCLHSLLTAMFPAVDRNHISDNVNVSGNHLDMDWEVEHNDILQGLHCIHL